MMPNLETGNVRGVNFNVGILRLELFFHVFVVLCINLLTLLSLLKVSFMGV